MISSIFVLFMRYLGFLWHKIHNVVYIRTQRFADTPKNGKCHFIVPSQFGHGVGHDTGGFAQICLAHFLSTSSSHSLLYNIAILCPSMNMI